MSSPTGFWPSKFIFATGIENSYPTIVDSTGKTMRVDEMESCHHYTRWQDDFELVKEVGTTHLRYGPPYFKTHLGPGKYDWSFAEETFAKLKEKGIVPIADLCHFGVPDWIANFQNEDWPNYFAEYARDFAKKFPWIRWYTPVNEIFVAATFSAKYGWWNERLSSDEAFVMALKNLCKANILAMRSILAVQPRAIFVQSESSEYFHAWSPECIPVAEFHNERRFLALDLTYGHEVDASSYEYLMDNGMSRDEYHWFLDNHVKTFCILGTDYYATNEHLAHADGALEPSGEIFGYYVLTKQYYDRYQLPVMHTETNVLDASLAPRWLRKEWANVYRLIQDGIPVVGFTWYSLTDQVDWDVALREKRGQVNPCGLYDLDRKIRPVGKAYRELITQWREILPTGSKSLQMDI